MKLVITMSRRFGTGASIIAEELSNMKVKLKQSGNWLKALVSSSDDAPQIF